MKFRNQTRLCLAIYDFEARIMLSLCLTFQGLPVREKFNSNVAAKCEYIFSDFLLIYKLSQRYSRLVLLANAYNSIRLIKFKE